MGGDLKRSPANKAKPDFLSQTTAPRVRCQTRGACLCDPSRPVDCSTGQSNYSRICFVSAETFAIASLFRSPLLKPWLTLTLPSTHIITVTSAFGLIL